MPTLNPALPFNFDDSTLLGPRLALIRLRMERWRPRRISDLLKPGYGDRFNYYTQLFALFIALIGVIGVTVSIIQTAYTIKATNDNSLEIVILEVLSTLKRVESSIDSILDSSIEITSSLQELQRNISH